MTSQLLDEYLACARKRSLDLTVTLREVCREELVTIAGSVVSQSRFGEQTVTSYANHSGQTWSVRAGVDFSPERAVDILADISLAESAGPPEIGAGRARVSPATPLSALAPSCAVLTREDPELLEEVILTQDTSWTSTRSSSGSCIDFAASSAQLLYRGSSAAASRAHVDWRLAAADAPAALERFRSADHLWLLRPSLRAAPAAPPALLPDAVVLSGPVACSLLAVWARNLAADAVEQGRSRFTDGLGRTVTHECFSVLDDPMHRGAPTQAPCDDEGTGTARRTLIQCGQLVGLLLSRQFCTDADGSQGAGGNAWRSASSPSPRPAPCNIWLESSGAVAPQDAPAHVRVIQATGLQLSNDLTGSFSMGASGIIAGDCDVRQVSGLSIAGNIFDLFRMAAPVGTAITWSRTGGANYGCPDLLCAGLSVGWRPRHPRLRSM